MTVHPPFMLLLWRASIAGVWLYQGLWHKVFASDDRHRLIMVAALGEAIGPSLCVALGLLEAALGIAVLVNFQPRLVAGAQIALLVVMNSAGLIFAGKDIPDPGGMVTMNLAFAMSIWMQARSSARTA